MDNSNDSLVMTIPQVARALSLSRNGAYAMAKSGQIPIIRVGKRVLVSRCQFERLLSGEWKPKTEDRAV